MLLHMQSIFSRHHLQGLEQMHTDPQHLFWPLTAKDTANAAGGSEATSQRCT